MGRFRGLLVVPFLVLGCREEGRAPAIEVSIQEERSEPGVPMPSHPPPPVDECAERISRLREGVSHEGAKGLQAHRAEILARARSVPVLFLRSPRAPQGASEKVTKVRQELTDSKDPAHTIFEILKSSSGLREFRRQVFLSEGYLYAETPHLALRLSQILRLDHLFSDERIVIQRGGREVIVTREQGRYYLPATPVVAKARGHGAPASLLLFDRVRSQKSSPVPSLHVDLGPLQRSLAFSRASVLHRGESELVLALRTDGVSSRVIVGVEGSVAKLDCESPGKSDKALLDQAREGRLLDQELIDPVLSSAHEMIRRRLPFDEPKTEEGQQDGLLRIHFRKAYRSYNRTYEFNGDKYYVFDGFGRPRLPQVCIDFITDAFDWGTGGIWPNRGEKRNRVRGALHFPSMGIENPRSIESLAEFASQTPEWFEMLWIEKPEQVKFRHRDKFFAALARDADRYQRGDVVFIYGLRDDGKFHFHSFLIDEKDPITGIPTVVLANAGPPQARSWEGEMANAPRRSIVARMRLKRELLLLAREQAKNHPGVPLLPPPKPEVEAAQ